MRRAGPTLVAARPGYTAAAVPIHRGVTLASSSDTAGRMMTSSPCFQLTGVATFFDAVS